MNVKKIYSFRSIANVGNGLARDNCLKFLFEIINSVVGNRFHSAKLTTVLVDWDDNTSKKGPIYSTNKPRKDSDEVGETCVTMQLCVHDATIGGILSFFFYPLFTISLPQA